LNYQIAWNKHKQNITQHSTLLLIQRKKINHHHMKIRYLILAIATSVVLACAEKKEHAEHDHAAKEEKTALQPDTIRKSIPKEEYGQVGNTHVTIKYHAPAVRGRTIWGGLVHYGEVWVTGAHSATSVEIDKPILVEGKKIPGGKYALFTIPGKEKWIIIINKNWEQHLADEYDEKDDILRLEVVPQQLENIEERLRYAIVPFGDAKGAIEMSWEKIKVSLPFETK
jgi:hypothetical protein